MGCTRSFCVTVLAALVGTLIGLLAGPAHGVGPVPYDIVYVRQPRFGDTTNTTWPEVFHPAEIDPGADLMLLHPDGSEEVIIVDYYNLNNNGFGAL